MVSNFNRGHNLSLKLLCIWRRHVVFYPLNCNFPASPFTFKNLRRMSEPNFPIELEAWKLDEILLSVFLDLLYDKSFKIDETMLWRHSFKMLILKIIKINILFTFVAEIQIVIAFYVMKLFKRIWSSLIKIIILSFIFRLFNINKHLIIFFIINFIHYWLLVLIIKEIH